MLLLSLGIWFWRHAQQRRPGSAPLILVILVVQTERQLSVLFAIVRAIALGKEQCGVMARAAPSALLWRAHGSTLLHRPQRSCSIRAVKLMSHVCGGACSAVRRHAEFGWRRERMK